MPGLIKALRRRLRWLFDRRYYFVHKVFGSHIPQHNLSYLPDGFTVTKLGQTGVSVIDGFCTPAEAREIIDYARERVRPAAVMEGGKFVQSQGRQSDTLRVFGPGTRDPRFLSLACRAAAVTGMPYTHLDGVYVTRYPEGGYYNEHLDFGRNFEVDRLYTVLLYLNDMPPEQGGSTAFPNLHIVAQPRVGRAVSWTNMNPDGSPHNESSHAALPVKAGGEKWTIQFWFHPYKMFREIPVVPPQTAPGVPMGEHDPLPDGAAYFVREKP